MLRKESYKDLDKWRGTCRKQKQRYYGKSVCGRNPWFDWQDEIVLRHEMTDHEISVKVGHSVKVIQIRRSRLKKKRGIT